MGKLAVDISMSLDGFVAGPNPTLERPLGDGGESLHEWALALESWRRPHGLPGGETNASTQVVEEGLAATGAVVMGRRMFSGGEGPWEGDPNADAWWGDDPPFHVPVFILTHHPRETVTKDGGTTFAFVTGGWRVRTNTGTWNGGSSPHQPSALGSSSHGPSPPLNMRRPITTAPVAASPSSTTWVLALVSPPGRP